MQRFLNNWSTPLAAPLTAGATAMDVSSAAAAELVGLGAGDHYLLTLVEVDANGREVDWEIVKATANAGGTLTIERDQEGSGARDWPSGTPISVRLTAGALAALGQAGGAQVGDCLTSARALGAGWLAVDGSAQAKGSYPALSALLGDRLARLRRSSVVRPDATGTPGAISSGNGIYLISFSASSQLVRSANGGATWAATAVIDAANVSVSVNGLAFGAGVFVAVGSSGRIAYSADGLSWTLATSPFSTSAVRNVAFGGGLFVAVADSGKLATSPDGITWTLRTSQFGTSNILGIAYGNGRFVVVGASGKVAYSTDGLVWTLGTSGTSGTLNAVGAVASGFVTYDTSLAYTSSDGSTWASNNPGHVVNDAFVASGGRVLLSGPSVLESTDGVTWTAFDNPLPGGADVKSFFDDGALEVVGGSGTMLLFRPEGGSWSRKINPAGTSDIGALAYGAGKYVAISAGGDLVVSVDAATWTRVELPLSVAPLSAVYGNGLFVVGCSAGKVMTSVDGETWSVATISGLESYSAGVAAYGGGRFAIIYNNFCASSVDGVSWTVGTVGGGGTALIAYGAGRWVLTTSGSTIMTSADAITWATHLGAIGSPVGLAFGNGVFVAVDASRVCRSRDGLAWEVAGPAPEGAVQLAFGEGVFVLVASHPRLLTSLDGEHWESLAWIYASESAPTPKRVLAASGRALVGGSGGYLATYTPDFDMATHFALPSGDRRAFIKAL
ncbi:hypothetical protein NG726_11500 [Pseudomonas sp. MOB-449]|nr:hypothetical protein [Pseudomonas sp. MOB-449]